MCFQFPKKFGCLFHIATRIISSEIETQHDQRRDEANSRTTSNWWSGTVTTTRNNEKWSSRRGESLYIQLRHTSAFTCEIEHWVNEKKDWISSHRYPKTWYTTEEIQLFFSPSSSLCMHSAYDACMRHIDDISIEPSVCNSTMTSRDSDEEFWFISERIKSSHVLSVFLIESLCWYLVWLSGCRNRRIIRKFSASSLILHACRMRRERSAKVAAACLLVAHHHQKRRAMK